MSAVVRCPMTDPFNWATARHEWDDVTRISPLTGKSATMRLAATPEEDES